MQNEIIMARRICTTLADFLGHTSPSVEMTKESFLSGDIIGGNSHLSKMAESMLLVIQSIHEVAVTLPVDDQQAASLRRDAQVSLESINTVFSSILEARQQENYPQLIDQIDSGIIPFINEWEKQYLPRMRAYLNGS